MSEAHPYQKQALEVFASAWAKKSRDSESENLDSAKSLARHTTEAKDHSVYVWSTILAIKQFASSHPQALDSTLLVYLEATKLYPDAVSNEYGHGPAAGIQQLKWWLVEESDGFQGLLFPTSLGYLEPTDRSNIIFKESDVRATLDGVLKQIQDWRGERTSWIIAAAMQARCFALDVMRVNEGRQIEALIDSSFDRGQRRWSKADFIGACVLLRGCARSLTGQPREQSGKRDKWKSVLEEFILQGSGNSDNDFVLKSHAALALRNLTTGPADETSEELFATHTWIY